MRTLGILGLLLAAGFCASSFLAPPAPAATITIVNLDGVNEGFNDPTAAAPVGGNPGTTVGAQRLYVFQYAANLWGSILPSTVEIRVGAQFNPQTCTATTGVLGSAGPVSVWRDFSGALLTGHWYHDALADKLAGSDRSGGSNDINATFNSSIGGATCLPMGWYYGVDGNEGSQIELLPVVLHELGHGLGFSTTTTGSTGQYLNSFPAVWDRYLLDTTTGLHWDALGASTRAQTAVGCKRLVWDGAITTRKVPEFQGGRVLMRVNSPAGIAGDYRVGTAVFGPPVDAVGVTGNVVLVNDGFGNTSNGCEPLVNGGAVSGNIALIDRGTCTFVSKVLYAQDAGAIAVIVADSVTTACVAGMGGEDETIVIPAVRITKADGQTLKNNLALGVNVTLILDPARLAGADNAGRMLMYTPNPYESGSSVSHFDVSADPNLLMEPAINTSLNDDADLTTWVFADIGWFNELTPVPERQVSATRLEGNSPNPFQAGTTIRFSLAREQQVELAVYDLAGRLVASLHRGSLGAGEHSVRWDGRDLNGRGAAPGIYLYRLRSPDLTESRPVVLVQ